MKILFDTNVVLDVLLDREPFVGAIVTRNQADFEKAGLAVYSPEELARALDPRARDAD